jgi:hypothetical protein
MMHNIGLGGRAQQDRRGSPSTPRTTRPTQLHGEQMFASIGTDAYDAEHRPADDLSGTAHAQGEGVEVDVDHVEVGERACPPRLQAVLQRGHHAKAQRILTRFDRLQSGCCSSRARERSRGPSYTKLGVEFLAGEMLAELQEKERTTAAAEYWSHWLRHAMGLLA